MPQEPPDMPQELPHDVEGYVSYADELEEQEGKKKKGEGGKGEGDTDNGGDAGDAARRNMTVEEIIEEEEVKESWLEKLKLIFIAPFSHIIPGTVSYTAENDLSKKAFFLRVGLYNRQIEPTDIADPDLIKKLEDRHQERRSRFDLGLSVPLEYLRYKPKPKGLASPHVVAPALGATGEDGGGESGGGSGTEVKASSGVNQAKQERTIFRRTSIEERELMATTGLSLAEAKAEIDEYTTPEEFLQEMEQAEAFGHIIQPTEHMEFRQAFNYVAAQTGESVVATLRKAIKFTDRDGKQESVPSFPIPESR